MPLKFTPYIWLSKCVCKAKSLWINSFEDTDATNGKYTRGVPGLTLLMIVYLHVILRGEPAHTLGVAWCSCQALSCQFVYNLCRLLKIKCS